MKNLSLLTGVIAFSVLVSATACNQGKNNNTAATTTTAAAPAGGGGKIAWVNIDTLESQYVLMKAKREELKQRQEQMSNELERSYQQIQEDAAQVQKKIDAQTITKSEYEAAQKRLGQMQQSLATRKQTLEEQFLKDQNDFNMDLHKKLDEFLLEYNKTKGYDYILSKSMSGSPIMLANPGLDITADVVAGLNELAKNEQNKK
jgi:outer membrane protein